MTKILQKDIQLKYVSKSRPKSLILRIPASIRDILELKYDDTVTLEACMDENQKYLKVYKKLD